MNINQENTIRKGKKFSLNKAERLSSKKTIDRLFTEGESVVQYPVKIVFLTTDLDCTYPAQAGFTTSKKNFKRAVARNRVKRLLREAYRLNKNKIYNQLTQEQLALFFIYIGKELPSHETVNSAIEKGLNKLLKKIQQKTTEGQQEN